MPKRFLVITSSRSKDTSWSDRETYIKDFYESLENYVDDISVAYTTYNDISCSIKNGQVQIFDNRHKIDLKDVDMVHFKNWLFDSEHASLIAFYLNQHGVNFFNSEVDAGLAWGKISQLCRLAMRGIPVPNTFFAKQRYLKEVMNQPKLPVGLSFPLIMKADDGAKGEDNHLLKSAKEALKILNAADEEKDFILQEYHPNDGDYRFLFIGLDESPLVFIRRAASGSHLNNTSQGGSGEFVDVDKLPPAYTEYAQKAAQVLKREISGVDLLVDKKTGKPYILEVNSTPALATGYGVDKKLRKFATFLKHSLEVQEEEE